jgi:hypothetical protein
MSPFCGGGLELNIVPDSLDDEILVTRHAICILDHDLPRNVDADMQDIFEWS